MKEEEAGTSFVSLLAIATGGFSGVGSGNGSRIIPFLVVRVPFPLASNEHYILLSPGIAAATVSCERMLRDYSRNQSLNRWCFGSVLFRNKRFHAPSLLKMHLENEGFIFVTSKLISLTASKKLDENEVNDFYTSIDKTNYRKDLGFEEKPNNSQVLNEIADLRTQRKRGNLSQAKCSLLELLLPYDQDHPVSKTIL